MSRSDELKKIADNCVEMADAAKDIPQKNASSAWPTGGRPWRRAKRRLTARGMTQAPKLPSRAGICPLPDRSCCSMFVYRRL